ncbi:MAG: lytic murein transglycosylase [Deltaproteobacteria bacterium]|jgi:membrane-bound lytic murein transglycosylase B|nr:lytic murein transglycosylase [Deltaproteobacteria bacterium]
MCLKRFFLSVLGVLCALVFMTGPSAVPAESSLFTPSDKFDPSWLPLLHRLKKDNVYSTDVEHWFSTLPRPYSPVPMGAKISHLFRMRFMQPSFAFFRKPPTPQTLYDGVVNAENIRNCLNFLHEHAKLFQQVEERYFVPKEVLAALLLVESRLGSFVGKENSLWTLACMAASNQPEQIVEHMAKLPFTEGHLDWLRRALLVRSSWAYAELKALIEYCRRYEHNPLEITGSVYGAIGLGQFMPSNITPYAVDGDNDGRIDLFSLPDALHSSANFLKAHGWKKGTGREAGLKALLRYNNSTAYANTILALAEGMLAAKKKA